MRMAAGAAALVCALCGCAGKSIPASSAPIDAPKYGLEARLKPLHTAISGKVRIIERGDGVTVLVSATNLPNDHYRVVLHESPNCNSPNGFAVGLPWAPAGAATDPRELIPMLYANQDGVAEASVHVRGLHTTGPDGAAGHSVVIYTGARATDALPDVSNNRIACGTFEAAAPFEL